MRSGRRRSGCERTGASGSVHAGPASQASAQSPSTASRPSVTDSSATTTARSPTRAPAPTSIVPPAASTREPHPSRQPFPSRTRPPRSIDTRAPAATTGRPSTVRRPRARSRKLSSRRRSRSGARRGGMTASAPTGCAIPPLCAKLHRRMAGKARRLALAGALIALSGCAGGAGDRDERLRLTTPGVKPIAVRDLPQGSADRPPGRVTKVIPLPAGPIGVGYGGGAVWATRDDGVVSRIDPGSGKVQRTRRVGERPIRVAVDGLGAWIANADSDTVSELDAHSGRARRTVAVGDRPSSVAVTPDAVWVATDRGGTLERIDRRRGEVVARIDIGAAIGTGRQVAAGLGAIWVTGTDNVSRVDPATNAITATVRVDSPNDVTVGHDAV